MNVDTTDLVNPSALAVIAPLDLVGIDLYRDVHKGIRNGLFSLCERAGRVDPADDDQIGLIAADTCWMFELLDAHAEHEDATIGPALRELDESLDELVRREHAALDSAMHTISHLQRDIDGTRTGRTVLVRRWYLALASFTSAYLAHEATEELHVSPVLFTGLGADAVRELEGAIVASIKPDHFAGYLRLILPATNPSERADLIGGIRQAAPPEVFAATVHLASEVLLPADHERLVAALADHRLSRRRRRRRVHPRRHVAHSEIADRVKIRADEGNRTPVFSLGS